MYLYTTLYTVLQAADIDTSCLFKSVLEDTTQSIKSTYCLLPKAFSTKHLRSNIKNVILFLSEGVCHAEISAIRRLNSSGELGATVYLGSQGIFAAESLLRRRPGDSNDRL